MASGEIFVFKSHYNRIFRYFYEYNIYNSFVKLSALWFYVSK